MRAIEKYVNMIDLKREQELNAALELMHFAFRAVIAKPDQILANRGLSRVHHRILYFVGRHPGLSVNRLLEILAVSKQALNGPLRVLINQQLIISRLSETDRRVKQLELTTAGKQLEADLSGDQRRRFEAVFALVGDEKEAAWRETMRLLAKPMVDSVD